MGKKFGTSMFGFKRSMVIDYIESVNVEHTEVINNLTQQLNNTNQALNDAKAENSALKNNLKVCEEQLTNLNLMAQELRRRIEENEQMHQKIGDIFVEAKNSANTIIENATESAHSIVRSANECAANTLDDIAQTRSKLDNVRSDLSKMLNEFDSALNSISASLDKAKSDIKPNGFKVNTEITEDDLIGGSVIQNP